MLVWSLLVFLEKAAFLSISYLFVLWLCLTLAVMGQCPVVLGTSEASNRKQKSNG